MHSSYSNQRKNSNVLRFTPLGFKHPIDVQFPPRCLPVCGRCKKNFKTREHCRGRDCHTDLAWCESFVCVSLDKSCTDENGKLLDGPFVAKVIPPVGFTFKEGELDPLTPICAPCKDKNYTRTYCRQNKNHRQLPWSTVYVIVSLDRNLILANAPMSSPNSTGANDSAQQHSSSSSSPHKSKNKRRKKNEEQEDEESPSKDSLVAQQDSDSFDVKDKKLDTTTETSSNNRKELQSNSTTEQESREQQRNDDKERTNEETTTAADDSSENGEKEKPTQQQDADTFFCNIPHSRTFLATVSCRKNHLQWVDLDRMLESQVPIFHDKNNIHFPQDAYNMHHAARFHPSSYQGMARGPMPYFVNSLDNIGMVDNIKVGEQRRHMLPSSVGPHVGMVPYQMGGAPSSNSRPYNNFGYRSSPNHYGFDGGPYHPMMGNNPSMGHFDPVRAMNSRMPHMQQQQQQHTGGAEGGPIPFETPSMHPNMDFGAPPGGNGGYHSSQEIFYNDAMQQQRGQYSPMGFDRQSMMTNNNNDNIPFHPRMGRNNHSAGGAMPRMSMAEGMMHPDHGDGDGDMNVMNHPEGVPQSYMMRHTRHENMHPYPTPGPSDMMHMPMDAIRDQFRVVQAQNPNSRQPPGNRRRSINHGNHDGVEISQEEIMNKETGDGGY